MSDIDPRPLGPATWLALGMSPAAVIATADPLRWQEDLWAGQAVHVFIGDDGPIEAVLLSPVRPDDDGNVEVAVRLVGPFPTVWHWTGSTSPAVRLAHAAGHWHLDNGRIAGCEFSSDALPEMTLQFDRVDRADLMRDANPGSNS